MDVLASVDWQPHFVDVRSCLISSYFYGYPKAPACACSVSVEPLDISGNDSVRQISLGRDVKVYSSDSLQRDLFPILKVRHRFTHNLANTKNAMLIHSCVMHNFIPMDEAIRRPYGICLCYERRGRVLICIRLHNEKCVRWSQRRLNLTKKTVLLFCCNFLFRGGSAFIQTCFCQWLLFTIRVCLISVWTVS